MHTSTSDSYGLSKKQWLLLCFAFLLGVATVTTLDRTILAQNVPNQTNVTVSAQSENAK